MGAEPYQYLVDYEDNLQGALDTLRAHVFASGEYNGAEFNPSTPEEAMEMADADGTGSILDIQRITSQPDFCCAAPFSSNELQAYFGTETPTRQDVLKNDMFWDDLERGQARYVVVYDDGKPTQLFFAGYSFD